MRHGKDSGKTGSCDDHSIFGDATVASQEKEVKMTSTQLGYAMVGEIW